MFLVLRQFEFFKILQKYGLFLKYNLVVQKVNISF